MEIGDLCSTTNGRRYALSRGPLTRRYAVDLTGGVEGFLTQHIGVIGDIRYFRSIEKESALLDFSLGSFNFWRLTAGVTFAF
ncbi:MAG: hypothetical protein IH798_07040 [Gemmatimonadetes bacterium]|nr:hypothetical protein [Gemmatimonadota bacterium]